MKEEVKALLFVAGQARIAQYLEKEIQDGNRELEEHILKSKKPLDECWKYVTQKARKLATDGCAVVDDTTVYEWVLKYYFADGEPEDLEKPAVKTPKPADADKKKLAKKDKPKETETQINLEDLGISTERGKPAEATTEAEVQEVKESAEINNASEEPCDAAPVPGEELCCAICGKKMKDAYVGRNIESIRKWTQGWLDKYGAVFCCKEHMELFLKEKEMN